MSQMTNKFTIDNKNRLYIKLYDKGAEFNFHIVNFQFLSRDVRSYGVYISQLIRYARYSTYYMTLDIVINVNQLRAFSENFMTGIQI